MSEPELYDRPGSLKRMGGDEVLFGEMVGLFLSDVPQWLNELRRGLENNDNLLVQRSAHTLKGLAANFGASPAMSAASQVEQFAREGIMSSATAAFPQLEAAMTQLMAALAPDQIPTGTATR